MAAADSVAAASVVGVPVEVGETSWGLTRVTTNLTFLIRQLTSALVDPFDKGGKLIFIEGKLIHAPMA